MGALVPGQDAALAVGLPVMLVHMVLGVINPAGAQGKEQSALVQAVARASPLKWCIEGLCCAELRGLELDRASLSEAPLLTNYYLLTNY